MADVPLRLREVIPNQTVPEKTRDVFNIATGATLPTLQEVKLPDGAGGFVYSPGSPHEAEGTFWRNRFITWRSSGEFLELHEIDMDHKLQNAKVKYRFNNSPILSNGVGIFETANSVVILVATVGSVHKMVFPHPRRISKQQSHLMQNPLIDGIPSVFAEASSNHAKDIFHVIPSTGTTPLPHLAATWLHSNEEAIFALANSIGQINVVKLSNLKGMVTVNQLKMGSYLGRIWGNIGGILTKSSSIEGSDAAVSLEIHKLSSGIFIFGLCKDDKLRIWSATTFDCVLVEDICTEDVQNLIPGSQYHKMRKVAHMDHFALVVYLCYAQNSQFRIIQPTIVNGQFQLNTTATVYAPEYDLIDFQASSNLLWGLWVTPDSSTVLKYATFSKGGAHHYQGSATTPGWINVVMEPQMNPDFCPGQDHLDPRQAFLQQLFMPGKFSMHTLGKTLSIFKRSNNASGLGMEQMTMEKLYEEVCTAVESEIQAQVTEYEVTDEDYRNVALAAWSRFYSCAIQYHQADQKAMGLICDDPNSGLICVIKKTSLSFARPVDELEHLVLTSAFPGEESDQTITADIFRDTPILCEDPALARDVVAIMRAVNLVHTLIPPKLIDFFSTSLSRLASPDQSGRLIVKTMLTKSQQDDDEDDMIDEDFTQELSTRLQQVSDVAKALEILFKYLELDRGIVAHKSGSDDTAEDLQTSLVFASPIGVSVVSESLNQFTNTRFELSRDLIILQLLILEYGFSSDASEIIHSTLLPKYVVLTHCYYLLIWMTLTTASSPPANSLEQGLRLMSVLKISEKNSDTFTSGGSLAQLTRMSARPFTLAELFVRGPGGPKMRSLLTSDTYQSASWHSALIPLVSIGAQLLWPRCTIALFQEFLLSACQHIQIQEYVRLLSTWCDWNCQSRQFLLGTALLNMGEPEKASDWLIKAADGVLAKDIFLLQQVFTKNEINTAEDRLHVLYFFKVIELFEQFGYDDFVIELAKTAMDVCNLDENDRVKLCHILFSHHLKLGHNAAAYDSMIMNPNQERRLDSLRQFVITLFERKELKELTRFPYIDMFDEFERIVESRARAVDLAVYNYYDFLYSFHITKENYRKAAQVMYECGMRIGTELTTPEGLKQQAKCYLACLNCLKLVNPNYAWIIKPITNGRSEDEERSETMNVDLPPGMSPKRNLEGNEIFSVARTKMTVLEYPEIEKEFELVCAKLKLVSKTSDRAAAAVAGISGPSLSPHETVTLLLSANLFENAEHIAKLFNLQFEPIIESLTTRCVKLSSLRPSEKDRAWEWLCENNSVNVDIRTNSSSSVEAAWMLLETVIERLEVPGQSSLLKTATAKIITMGASLPVWLISKYKKTNAAELMRLYMNNGWLEDAAKLAIEYLQGVLGSGKEHFGLQNSINANAPAVWIPYNVIDHIAMELEYNSDNPAYEKLSSELLDTVEKYLTTADRVSSDMLDLQRGFYS